MGNRDTKDRDAHNTQPCSRKISGKGVPRSAATAIRRYCADCFEGRLKDCRIPECPLWEWRFGQRPTTAKRKGLLAADRKLGTNSPLRTIRLHCVECCGDNIQEVKHCPSTACPLWPYRFGQTPATARKHGKLVDPEEAS